VNSIRRKGRPIAISSAAVTAAIGPGRRMTICEKRYHPPSCTCRASRSSDSFQRLRPSAFTRGPRTASIAGSTVSDTAAAVSATSTPPYPIENRNRRSNTISEPMAAATVMALNSTVRPAVRIVRRSASDVSTPFASSSRKRETTKSE
jgi:hypothetical protein